MRAVVIIILSLTSLMLLSCGQKQLNKQELQHSLTQRAEQGDVHAQFELGKFYFFLEEDPARYEKAFPLFLKAAEKGNMYATHYLGRMYHYGYFVQKDEIKAKEYFSKSIATMQNDSLKKNPEAWYCLGWSFYYGVEVEKNETEAVKWFEKAAKNGHVIAQYNLGLCYIKGEGVEKDQKQAEKWMLKAAERNDAMAQFVYAHQTYWFTKINHLLTADPDEASKLYQLLSNNSEMQIWISRAAHQGLSYAQYLMGVKNDNERNYDESLRWKLLAAEKGHCLAQYDVGAYYYSLWEKNSSNFDYYYKAIKYIEKSALQGYFIAEGRLGVLYASSVKKNEKLSLFWLEKAAYKGDWISLQILGRMYFYGQGLKQNKCLGYALRMLGRYPLSDEDIIREYSSQMNDKELNKSESLKKEIRTNFDRSLPDRIIKLNLGFLNMQSISLR